MNDDRAPRQTTDDAKEHSRPERKCPICGKPATIADDPFCSKRCADVDLNRWLVGLYALPATVDPDDEEPTAD